jgi:hypothetical protein
VYNEGNVNSNVNGNTSWHPFPFELPYRSITPVESDATNLLVTCCLSVSAVLSFIAHTRSLSPATPATWRHTHAHAPPPEQHTHNNAQATHIAYGSIRLEPQLMMLGEAAGVAAAMAAGSGVPVQRVDVAGLQQRLRAQTPFAAILHESQMVVDAHSTSC